MRFSDTLFLKSNRERSRWDLPASHPEHPGLVRLHSQARKYMLPSVSPTASRRVEAGPSQGSRQLTAPSHRNRPSYTGDKGGEVKPKGSGLLATLHCPPVYAFYLGTGWLHTMAGQKDMEP